MRRCRIREIKLKPENELFLQFCMSYGTPEQERRREIYEAADLAQREKEAKDSVSSGERHPLRTVRDGVQPLFCTQAKT